MAPSAAEVRQVMAALDRLSGAARADWATVWVQLGDPTRAEVTQALRESWRGVIEQYGDMAATLAADLFEDQAEGMKLSATTKLADGIIPDQADSNLEYAARQPNASGVMGIALDRLVKQPFRRTFQESAWASKAGWARVPTGPEPCQFCLMLASRGGVYHSQQIAKLGLTGHEYHGDCGCVPVLVRNPSDYPSGYAPDALYNIYSSAAEQVGNRFDTRAILAQMRANANH